jgi:hypothetical protein
MNYVRVEQLGARANGRNAHRVKGAANVGGQLWGMGASNVGEQEPACGARVYTAPAAAQGDAVRGRPAARQALAGVAVAAAQPDLAGAAATIVYLLCSPVPPSLRTSEWPRGPPRAGPSLPVKTGARARSV